MAKEIKPRYHRIIVQPQLYGVDVKSRSALYKFRDERLEFQRDPPVESQDLFPQDVFLHLTSLSSHKGCVW